MKKLLRMGVMLGILIGGIIAPTKAQENDQVESAIEQTYGNYPEMSIDYIGSLGMLQKAWNNPMRHMGEGQTKPGYTKYNWRSDVVLPVRLREGMMTLINFPEWELIENVWIGSEDAFSGKIPAPNALILYPVPGVIGVDSNLVVFGRSGNRYTFYLRSESYNTERITHSVVDIVVPGGLKRSGQRNASAAGGAGFGGNFNGAGAGAYGATQTLFTASNAPADWMEQIPVDPEQFRFDIDVYAPNPNDFEIAPERVWRDNIFTYIDMGPKALTMNERPIVNLIIQDVETPVSFRTRGKHGRLIVVEGQGDMVLRNGKRIICLKLRRDPAYGLENAEYARDASGWEVPPAKVTTGGSAMAGANGTQIMTGQMAGMVPLASTPELNREATSAYEYLAAAKKSAKSRPAANSMIAIELGSDANIANLERKWDTISKDNKDLLGSYDPFFSVDVPATGREIYHLRMGPVPDVSAGDSLCKRLARRGVSCSVIKTQ